MFKRRLPFLALSAVAFVLRRRLSRGPHRPSWTWTTEIFVEVLRRIAFTVNELPLAEQATIWDSLAQPHPVTKQVRFEATSAGGIPAEWISPPAASSPVILYLHGGWYSGGSLTAYREFLARLALATGTRVLFLDYRLAPAHPYPAAVEDTLAAWRWLTTQAKAEDIFVAGDSAGAGLALALMLRLREAGAALPKAAVLICPWVDLAATGGSILDHAEFDWAKPEEVAKRVKLYIGDGDPKRPEVSPVFADLRGLPPMMIQAGGAEMMLDQENALAARARGAGVDVTYEVTPDMIHNWQIFAATIPEGLEAIERIGAFVKARLSRAVSN